MVRFVHQMKDFPFGKVMEIYVGSNTNTAKEQWPELPEFQALYRAEMDFYQYLRHDFFTMGDSFYALWEETGRPVAAVRFERWKDGWLLEGLETHPGYRGRGYATALVKGAMEKITGKVYAHVAKGNAASVRVHEKCGFRVFGDTALVDGSYDGRFLTLMVEM